ncbi:unnamed protein product [Penicillium manginii]
MPPKEKYTDPELRDEVKEEIHKSDKGGKPGQWSARKAQLMASEYKKRGGGYNQSKEEGQDESQKHLDDWTKEDWQTKEGSGTAKRSDGSRQRYLPKEAWDKLSDKEKEKTDKKKVSNSKKGKQFVGNTRGAKEAGQKARKDVERVETDEEEDKEAEGNGDGEGDGEGDKGKKDPRQGREKGKQQAGTKRRAKQKNGPNKKQEVKRTGKENTEDEELQDQNSDYAEDTEDAEDEEDEAEGESKR